MDVGICDEFGVFIGAKTHWISPILDVSLGEAMSLLLAIKWVRELGFTNIIFELDAKVAGYF